MDKIRDAIVETLQGKFPDMATSIFGYHGQLDDEHDRQISYSAPGIAVSILPSIEVPDGIAPWELQGEFGLTIAVKAASAKARDKEGWRLCMRVVDVVYGNTWGISGQFIRPAKITGIAKLEARNPDGTPTGVNYWRITFYNWLKIEALI
jgi:hypothetical protein